MEFLVQYSTMIWLVLIILFAIVEAITIQLVSIWFAVGALAAVISDFLGASITVQIVVFVAASIICLIATRPLVKKFTATGFQSTNADRCIGDKAVVTEEIDNIKATGQVKTNGNVWTARSYDNSVIPKDSIVVVRKIEGVKLIVQSEKE